MTTTLKSLFLFLLAFNSITFSLAQKCQFEKNEVDGLTEMTIKRTTQQLLLRVNNDPVYFKAQCIGNNRYLKMYYFTHGNFSFREEREIKLVTTLKHEVVLFPREATTDNSKVKDLYNVRSMIVYKLSAEQYQLLTENGILTFKYFVATGWNEKSIKPAKQGTLQKILRCVE